MKSSSQLLRPSTCRMTESMHQSEPRRDSCQQTDCCIPAQTSKSVMVSVGVSALGCTELIFIEPGVKINGNYYRDELLTKHLLPAIKELAGDYFTFQQDSAPAQTVPTSIRSITKFGAFSKNESIVT